MALGLVVIGILLLVSAVRNTTSDLFTLVKGDFTGQQNFTIWATVIVILGLIGYNKTLRPVSTAFLGLVLFVIFIKNGGVITNLVNAVNSTKTAGSTGSILKS